MTRDEAITKAVDACIGWFRAHFAWAFEYGRHPLHTPYQLPATIDAGQLVAMLEALGLLDFKPKEEVADAKADRAVPRYPSPTAVDVLAEVNIGPHVTWVKCGRPIIGNNLANTIVKMLEAAGFKIVKVRPDAKDE